MVGGIVIAAVLAVFPVVVLMSMGALAAILAITTNETANADHVGSELYEVAHADP